MGNPTVSYNSFMNLRKWQLALNLTLPDSYVSKKEKEIIRKIISISAPL